MPPENDPSANLTTPASGQPTKLYAGKYQTVEALEAGYENSLREVPKIVADRDKYKTQLEALIPLLESQTNGTGERMSPAARAQSRQGYDPNEEFDPSDPNQLEARINQSVERVLAPFVQGITAKQTVLSENPDLGKFEPEINQFLQANPNVAARVQAGLRSGDPNLAAMAYDYGYKAWQAAGGNSPNTNPTTSAASNSADATGAGQVFARLDAMLPGAGGRGAEGVAQQKEALAGQYLNEYSKTGDKRFLNEFLGIVLNESGVVPIDHVSGKSNPQGNVI